MNRTDESLLLLLRVALSDAVGHSLAKDIDWQAIYRLAQMQGVVALAFDGLQKICVHDPALGQSLSRSLKLHWIAATEQVRSRYGQQKLSATRLTALWAEKGIRTLVLQGLAFSVNYPVPSYRECGDFDCYLFGEYEKGEEVIRQKGIWVDEDWYKHSQFSFMGVLVENHAFLVPVRKNKDYRELERYFEMLAAEGPNNPYENTNILIPSPLFNLSFCLYHALGHFMSEGIRLRHVCDWYCLLSEWQSEIDWDTFYAWCEKFHYRRFADVLTAICVHDLGLQISDDRIVTESPYRDKVLKSILYDDSAIFNLNKPKWYTRSKLIYNTFKYRWKYTQIYQKNHIRQIVNYMFGYLFKTEQISEKNIEK